MKTIITSGKFFADIDALACAIAYSDFLKAKNILSEVIFPGDVNETVTRTIKNWDLNYKRKLDDKESTLNFVVVDCSNPAVLPEFVIQDKIVNVYDHRSGYEHLWNNPQAEIKIELVGACATLVWERIKSEKLESKISQISLNLLYTAIFANTLNFKSSVTTERDRRAFLELKTHIDLENDWISSYYQEIESSILANPEEAVVSDTKVLDFPNLNLKIVVGQIELWDSKQFVLKNEKAIIKSLKSFGIEDWFFTSPSISEGKNYIYTQSSKVSKLLEDNFDIKFNGDWGESNKLWLRKEIVGKLLKI